MKKKVGKVGKTKDKSVSEKLTSPKSSTEIKEKVLPDTSQVTRVNTISDDKERISSIVGYTRRKTKKQSNSDYKSSVINLDANVSKVILVIGELVKPGEEFLTTPINEKLRKSGFSNGDISGQLYALKQNGTLSNRLPETDEEKDQFGKSIRIWTTSDKFWTRHEKLINEKKRQETDSNKIDDLSDDE